MRIRERSRWQVGAFVLLVALAQAAAARAYEVALPSGSTMAIEVPSGWGVEKSVSPLSVTLRLFSNEKAKHPTVQITAFALPKDAPPHAPDDVRMMAERGGRELLNTALQTTLEVTPVALASGSAFYYHLTDRKEERGENDFRELYQGVGEIAGHAFSFSMLTHPGQDPLVATALRAISTIKIVKK